MNTNIGVFWLYSIVSDPKQRVTTLGRPSWLVVWFAGTRGFGQLHFWDFIGNGTAPQDNVLETTNRSTARPSCRDLLYWARHTGFNL